PELRGEVSNIIKGLKQDGMTQIVVTHDMDFANEVADKQLHVVPVK
ncbi:MAG: amino acid ABC transporter ATP-binding protein, partial [Pediococcus parvulus]